MSDETTPMVGDDEPALIPPDAEEAPPVLPKGEYRGVLKKYAQTVLTFKRKAGTVRYDEVSVQVTHDELGIQFVQTSPFDRRYNTNYARRSGSSATRFRKQLGIEGATNAKLAEIVSGEPEVIVRVENAQRKDKDNLTADGKPTVIVSAIIADIHWAPSEA